MTPYRWVAGSGLFETTLMSRLLRSKFTKYSNIYPTRCKVTQFIISGNCFTCFGWYLHPSSGAHTTVSTASGICHTVVCALDDGWWYHPKHVKQFPDIINCVTLHLVGYILQLFNLLLQCLYVLLPTFL